MTDSGDDFRAHRDYERNKKRERERKFARNFRWIKGQAKEIGYSLHEATSGAWVFATDEITLMWWPGSGRTDSGDYFETWPDLKAHLVSMT